jgi:hypothetical protein
MDITTFNIAFVAMSSRRPMSQKFTSNATVTFPAGTVQVDMTGNGGRGVNAKNVYRQQYKRDVTYYGKRRSDGATVVDFQQFDQEVSGPMPATTAYCDAPVPTGSQSEYSSTQACYTNFRDTSYNDVTPATTGASATGIGKTFPGSTGDVTPTPTSFANVPVTALSPYNLVIPSGGSITINYYA